jgi:hypothetical protein
MKAMSSQSLSDLAQRYAYLRAQLDKQAISYPQFVEAVRQLRAQDAKGRWWTIDPQTGRYLTYAANGWVEAMPPTSPPLMQSQQASAPPVSSRAQPPAQPQQIKKQRGCLASPVTTGLLSFGAAVLWFLYTSASPSSEGMDLLTPLLIAGVPLALRLLQKPLDKLLSPLYKILNVLPRPLLVGAAFAIPFVIGGIFTRSYGSGFQVLRRSTVVSVILGYVLTRRPEGSV